MFVGMANRYRIYPDSAQVEVFSRHCADARYVWNLALEQMNHYDKRIPGRRSPGESERSRQLTELRQSTWLGEGSSPVQQQALRDFDRALKNWWGKSHCRPTWRKVGKHESFCVRDVSVERLSRKWASVHIPKCGRVRFRLSRPLPQVFGMARVTLDRSGRWHIAFSAPQPPIERQKTEIAVGIDLGVASTVTQSDGVHLRAPSVPANQQKRRLRLERRLARQCMGSARRERTRMSLARLAARQADRVGDWREKATTQLVIDNDLIVIEDLKVRNMMRSSRGTVDIPGRNVRAKSGLNRAIAEQGWSRFALRLEQKAVASGVEVIRVPAQFTSLRCSSCGHTTKENRKSQAAFLCESCGLIAHADVNAANNILAAGLAVFGRGGIVSPVGYLAARGGPDEALTTSAAPAA